VPSKLVTLGGIDSSVPPTASGVSTTDAVAAPALTVQVVLPSGTSAAARRS